MNLKQQMEAALRAAREIAEGAKGRSFTDDERAKVDEHLAKADELDGQIKAAAADEARMKRLGTLAPAAAGEERKAGDTDSDKPAATLGEHFAKNIGGAEGLLRLKEAGARVSTPEYKAATDPNAIGTDFAPVLTEVDRTIVRGFRRPTITDLLGSGSLSGNAVTYYVEGGVEGGFATVAEGAQKPQLHFINPTTRTDALKKIAAWFDTTDEMTEDLPYMVSEINNRGLYLLSLAEEAQLLSGDGTGTNVLGLLNRSGVQSVAQAATGDSPQDAIFRGLTAVQTATGLTADGIIMNPLDYQALRLSKDANGQYFGGGFFSGEYGNGGVSFQPPVWGQTTIVSAAVPAKTVVLGALKAATTVYRKGGVRVESTNSDLGKFTKNIVTTRIEERVALAVRIPSAVVKVTLQ